MGNRRWVGLATALSVGVVLVGGGAPVGASEVGHRAGTAATAPTHDRSRAVGPKLLVMGDSYSAGNGAGDYYGTSGCRQSRQNYGNRLGRHFSQGGTRVVVNVAACSGAETTDFFSDDGSRAAQLKYVDDSYDLVLLTLGGNDAGFGDIVKHCLVGATDDARACDRDLDRAERLLRDGTLEARLSAVVRRLDQLSGGTPVGLLGYPFLEGERDLVLSAGRGRDRLDVRVGRRLRTLQVQAESMQRRVMAATDDGARSHQFFSVQSLFDGPPFHGLYKTRVNPDRWMVHPLRDASVASRDTYYHPSPVGWAKEAELLQRSPFVRAALSGSGGSSSGGSGGGGAATGSAPTTPGTASPEQPLYGDPMIWRLHPSGPLGVQTFAVVRCPAPQRSGTTMLVFTKNPASGSSPGYTSYGPYGRGQAYGLSGAPSYRTGPYPDGGPATLPEVGSRSITIGCGESDTAGRFDPDQVRASWELTQTVTTVSDPPVLSPQSPRPGQSFQVQGGAGCGPDENGNEQKVSLSVIRRTPSGSVVFPGVVDASTTADVDGRWRAPLTAVLPAAAQGSSDTYFAYVTCSAPGLPGFGESGTFSYVLQLT